MADLNEQDFTDAEWDGDKSRFSVEELVNAVPDAVAEWARDQQPEGDPPAKADLKLPYREPDGTINLNGVRAALAAIGGARGGVDLPSDVQSSAREELEDALERGNEALGNDDDTEESVSESRDICEVYEPGFAFREATVDRDARTIRNVSLLGRRSRNNRTYSSTAMREAAEKHQNIGVFLDHPTKTEERERGGTRSVRDLAGRVTRATVEGDRVKGDVQVVEGSEGDKILSLAEQMPGVVGFSHRAKGKIRRGDEGDVVESVEAVHGADLVTDPATVDGLFEQIERDRETEMTLEELDADTLREERPDLVEELREDEDETSLEEENQRLREELDRLKAEKAEREHRELVEGKLEEAGLPDRAVTDEFENLLLETDDEERVDALIADRKELVEAARKGGPTSKSRDPDELFEDVSDEVDGEALQEAFETLW